MLFVQTQVHFEKNSTKKIEDLIFITKENLKNLNKDFENNKLEYEYLSSAEKLINFRDLYFDEEFIKKDIQDINLMFEANGKITTKKLHIIEGK